MKNQNLIRYESEIIDLMTHYNDMTTSDLQGTITALVEKIFKAGVIDGLDQAYKIYKKTNLRKELEHESKIFENK